VIVIPVEILKKVESRCREWVVGFRGCCPNNHATAMKRDINQNKKGISHA